MGKIRVFVTELILSRVICIYGATILLYIALQSNVYFNLTATCPAGIMVSDNYKNYNQMKLKDFRKKMGKGIFSTAEAQLVAFPENPAIVNLQLHQWKKNNDIIALKRGLSMFSDYSASGHEAEIARSLYCPCYFSLQQALSFYGIIPEATFTHTLVTTNTRHI